jgi:hypothetical protein
VGRGMLRALRAHALFPCVACPLQAALCVVVLFIAYVLQQRLVPFLSLRAFNNAVKTAAGRLKPASSNGPLAAGAAQSPGLMVSRPRVHGDKGRARRTAGRRKSTWFEPDPEDIARLRNANVRERLRLHNALVFVGVVMQRVMEDYNHLESTYLISGMLVLLAGLVFNGGGFRVGSVPYHLLTAAVAGIVVFATVAFVVLLAVELYKSFRDAALHAAMRTAEAASIETTLRTGVRSKLRGLEGSAARSDKVGASTTVTEGVDGAYTRPSGMGNFVVENPLRPRGSRDTRGAAVGVAVLAGMGVDSPVAEPHTPQAAHGDRHAAAPPPPVSRQVLLPPTRSHRVLAAQRPVVAARARLDISAEAEKTAADVFTF